MVYVDSFNIWIGLHDANNDDVWSWSDGTPLDYDNWFGNEPNQVDHNCGLVSTNSIFYYFVLIFMQIFFSRFINDDS